MKKIYFLIFIFIAGFYTHATASYGDSAGKSHSPCSPPVVTITSDTTICEGDTATPTATGGDTYLWSTGQTTSTIKVVPLSSIIYHVKVTVNMCSTEDSTMVSVVQSSYSSYITPTTATICRGSSGVNFAVVCRGGIPCECFWSPSTYLTCSYCGNPTADPPSSTTYTVTIEDEATGCPIATTVPVIVSNSLKAVISGADSICKGGSTTLTGSGGSTYLWNTGDTSNVITVNPSTTTIYSLKVTSGSCLDSTTFTLKVDSCAPLGINTIFQNKSVVLYPNPNNGQFTITLSHSKLVSESQPIIEIYNILGEQVYNVTLKQVQGDNLINLTEPSGVYFYRVITESGELGGEGKFIISH